MPASLNDTHISFSPELAATIGLEETILLGLLHAAQQWLGQDTELCIYQAQLESVAPFWSDEDVERIAQSLSAKGIINIHSAPFTRSLRLHCSLNGRHPKATQKRHAAPAASDQQAPPVKSPQYGAQRLAANWRPSRDVLAQLAQHNIPTEFIQRQVNDFILYWRERAEISHAWGSRFVKQVLRNWQHERANGGFQATEQQASAMHTNWRPSEDAFDILRSQQISSSFIQAAIPEFILYWRERGNHSKTWNSQFIKHIKRQWASHQRILQYDSEPKIITKDWMPSDDALEVLAMANIDLDFAQAEIPSFVLFWLESKKAQTSWNSKYIQHIKYQWAKTPSDQHGIRT